MLQNSLRSKMPQQRSLPILVECKDFSVGALSDSVFPCKTPHFSISWTPILPKMLDEGVDVKLQTSTNPCHPPHRCGGHTTRRHDQLGQLSSDHCSELCSQIFVTMPEKMPLSGSKRFEGNQEQALQDCTLDLKVPKLL